MGRIKIATCTCGAEFIASKFGRENTHCDKCARESRMGSNIRIKRKRKPVNELVGLDKILYNYYRRRGIEYVPSSKV